VEGSQDKRKGYVVLLAECPRGHNSHAVAIGKSSVLIKNIGREIMKMIRYCEKEKIELPYPLQVPE
jgi:hypothetical protein